MHSQNRCQKQQRKPLMTSLQQLLDKYRLTAESEREKGTYFEELILSYLKNESSYRDIYSEVLTYANWARQQGMDGRDTGIDLVAKTAGTGEYHAIQCKLYAPDYRLQKSDIDSFFTASGKRPFTHRIIVSTCLHWSEHAEEALRDPMRRAVAFCQVIEHKKGAKVHKVSSKQIASMFQAVVEAYQASETELDDADKASPAYTLTCEADHVDGSMSASEKEALLSWLKDDPPENTCRILSNVRCLSEGVDVPALDAVLFLTPRNSQVDVVQSVGRVMRNAPGKKRGYVVLPVVIPARVEPHEALNDNVTYKVVWQVLQALRSHDDKFDALINKLDLTGHDPAKMEVIGLLHRRHQYRSHLSRLGGRPVRAV